MTLLAATNSWHTWLSSHSSLLGAHCRSTPQELSRNLLPEHRSHTLTASKSLQPQWNQHTALTAQPRSVWTELNAHALHNQYYGNNYFHNGSGEGRWNYYLGKKSFLHLLLESNKVTEPREQWSGWEEPCCWTLTSKASTSTAVLYYGLYLMIMPLLPHFPPLGRLW